jgi:hypothetical protein
MSLMTKQGRIEMPFPSPTFINMSILFFKHVCNPIKTTPFFVCIPKTTGEQKNQV